MAVPQKTNTGLPYNLAITLLGIYPKEVKAGTQTYTCPPTITTALFTIMKQKVEATQVSINR